MSSKDIDALARAFALEIAALREAVVGSPNQWANALKVKGARSLQISRAQSQPVLYNGDGRLLDWSLRVDATATGPATITFRDGDGDGEILGTVSIAAGAASNHFLPNGVSVGRSLFAQVTETTAKTLTGCVYFHD